MAVIADQIPRRIRAKGRGWVFTPKDFLDLGTRAAVDQTLSRLAKAGTIRRIGRGVYDYPVNHSTLGLLSPDIDGVASATSAQTGDTAFPSGASAANYLGLSTQIPARPTYTTTGATKVKKIGGRTIAFKHSRAPILQGASLRVNYVLQALAYLGKDEVNDDVIQRCASRLNDPDMKTLIASKRLMPGWMADTITKIDRIRHGKLRT